MADEVSSRNPRRVMEWGRLLDAMGMVPRCNCKGGRTLRELWMSGNPRFRERPRVESLITTVTYPAADKNLTIGEIRHGPTESGQWTDKAGLENA